MEPTLSIFPSLEDKCEDLKEIAHTEEQLIYKSKE